MKHRFYFATHAMAREFKNNQTTLNTVSYVGVFKSSRDESYYAMYGSDRPISPEQSKTIAIESGKFGCTASLFNEEN